MSAKFLGRLASQGLVWLRERVLLAFALVLAVAVLASLQLGLRATREWQRSSAETLAARQHDTATLLSVALDRDMRGAHTAVLSTLPEQELVDLAPYELADRFARGFARFPYAESFFVWTSTPGGVSRSYVFHRADRKPRWDNDAPTSDPFPVIFHRDPTALSSAILAASSLAAGNAFTVLETSLGEDRYQMVSRLWYEGSGSSRRVRHMVGFLVNREWVRDHYFDEFVRGMLRALDDQSLTVQVLEPDVSMPTGGASALPPEAETRAFPLLFADAALLNDAGIARRASDWRIRVSVDTNARAAAGQGAARTVAVLALATLATLVALFLTIRAARASARLASVQSEFVSAVSHEMKTPLSLIRLASDTLAQGRYQSADAIADYGRLMGVEAHHLTRLIDNVLCFARINHTGFVYDVEPVDVAEVVAESLDRFRPRFEAAGITVEATWLHDPVWVRGDHVMLGQVFDNLLDNVLAHGAAGRSVHLGLASSAGVVTIECADRGEGIAPDDLPRVFDKFYRHKGARQRGAGLGLAIVRRIVEDHDGRVTIASTVGRGTTVSVVLPRSTAAGP